MSKWEGTIFSDISPSLQNKKQMKERLMLELESDVANFLSKGGTIQAIEKGAMTIDVRKTDHKQRDYQGRLRKKHEKK